LNWKKSNNRVRTLDKYITEVNQKINKEKKEKQKQENKQKQKEQREIVQQQQKEKEKVNKDQEELDIGDIITENILPVNQEKMEKTKK